jgi:transposase-like protein
MATIIEIQQEVEFFGMDWYDPDCYAIKILDAKYEKVQIDEVVNQLKHLNIQQKADIKRVLSEFTKIFDGTESTHIENSTLTWNQMLSLNMLGLIQCQ